MCQLAASSYKKRLYLLKEERFFYTPLAQSTDCLPDEETAHAVRVLRLGVGDPIRLMDGKGCFYQAEIVEATKKICRYKILNVQEQPRQWKSFMHVAMAPTKNMDRTEWFVEKAVEIGVDKITFLSTDFSERKKLNLERLEKIVVSAMKQSRKAYKTELEGLVDSKSFIASATEKQRFICHCYDNTTNNQLGVKTLLKNNINGADDFLVMVGPEGDFSLDEVVMAEQNGFKSASLGLSRLRTETAALAAVHILNIFSE